MKKVIALLAVLFLGLQLWAQAPVIVTKNTKTINGKKYYAHVVEKGQTVFSIARAYGVNYREAVLKSDIDKIAIGDTIFLPVNEVATPTKFRYYVVKQGNTLYSIAKTYKMEVDDILKLNPNIENNSIKVGEVIKIPMMNSSNGNDNKPQTSQPQQNSVNTQSQQSAPIYKPIKDSKQEAKEQKELEKQQKEAEAKAKKEQERLQKEAQEKEAKEKKELERLQKEAKAKEAKEKKELEKQQKEAEAKAKKEQERLQKEAEAKEAKEKKDLEKKQKEAKEKEIKEKKELERQHKEAEAKAKKELEEKERLQKEAKEKELKEKKELEKQQKEAEAKAKKEQERLQKEAEAKAKKELEEQDRIQKEAKEKELKEKKDLEKQQKEYQNNANGQTEQYNTNPKAEYRRIDKKSSQSSDGLSAIGGNTAQQPETKQEQPKPVYQSQPEPRPVSVAKSEPVKAPTTVPGQPEAKPAAQPKTEPKAPATSAPASSNVAKNAMSPNIVIRDRISKTNIQITLMIPLYLDNINEISTSKFDIEQRRKRKYKSFEFIQFYEGVLLGLESLKNEGCNVVLNVVDIPGDLPDKVAQAFDTYNVAQSDLIIALLEKNAFEKAAELAMKNNVFILNPFSTRPEILNENPYVVKLSPSNQGIVSTILNMVSKNYSSPNIYIIHSNSKSEKQLLDEFQSQLQNQKKLKYTIFDWSANAKLLNMLKNSSDDNIVINIYDQNKDKNKTQSSLILNRLFSLKKNTPTLITLPNWAMKYEDVDYSQLQRLNYHFCSNFYLDYNNPKHKAFIDRFKEKYKTEPQGNYAALGNDIIIHFVSGINSKGPAKFWQNPNIGRTSGMMYHFNFKRTESYRGFENQNAYFYRLNNKFQFEPSN